MKTRKRFLAMGLAFIFAFALFPTMALYANDITVTIDGEEVVFADQQPAIVDGRTLVPVRGVFEQMGFYVSWDGEARQATLTSDDYTVIITIDSATFTTNGVNHELDVPAQIIGGSTMVPIRFVLESVGYYLDWDGDTRTVLISDTPFAARTIAIYSSEGNELILQNAAGITIPAQAGTQLRQGYSLTTGAATFSYIDMGFQSLVSLDEHSRIVVESLTNDTLSLVVESGQVLVDVQGQEILIYVDDATVEANDALFVAGLGDLGETVVTILEGTAAAGGTVLAAGDAMHIHRIMPTYGVDDFTTDATMTTTDIRPLESDIPSPFAAQAIFESNQADVAPAAANITIEPTRLFETHARRLLDLVNEERARRGNLPLAWDSSIAEELSRHFDNHRVGDDVIPLFRNHVYGEMLFPHYAPWNTFDTNAVSVDLAAHFFPRLMLGGSARPLFDSANATSAGFIIAVDNFNNSFMMFRTDEFNPARFLRDGGTRQQLEQMQIELARQLEREIFEITNREREAHGLSPLVWDDALARASRNHSRDIIDNNIRGGHIGSDGSGPTQRGIREGSAFGVAGENVQQRFNWNFTAQDIHESWMNSPGHRRNILYSVYTHLGVGIEFSEGRIFFTQKFGFPWDYVIMPPTHTPPEHEIRALEERIRSEIAAGILAAGFPALARNTLYDDYARLQAQEMAYHISPRTASGQLGIERRMITGIDGGMDRRIFDIETEAGILQVSDSRIDHIVSSLSRAGQAEPAYLAVGLVFSETNPFHFWLSVYVFSHDMMPAPPTPWPTPQPTPAPTPAPTPTPTPTPTPMPTPMPTPAPAPAPTPTPGPGHTHLPETPPGSGTAANPYVLTTIGHLKFMAEYSNWSGTHWRLGADIGSAAMPVNFMIGGVGAANSFNGFFNGNNHNIHLDINVPHDIDYHGIGLFRYLGGPVRDLTLSGNVTGGFNATGSLAGRNSGRVENVSSSVNVTGNIAVGGLVGWNHQNNIINSHASGNVTALHHGAGGLVGSNNGTITDSSAAGAVSGGGGAGGLVGTNYDGGTIRNSHASGTVTGTGRSVGGLTGSCHGITENSRYTGNVTVTGQ
jgi:uncharacterized protein YkwD